MQMKVNPSENKIFLTEAPLNPKSNREKMVETMLEDFQFDACKIETQAILSLVAQGLNSGIVLDSGDGVSHCVSVCDSRVLSSSIKRIDIAGYDITKYLATLMLKRGYQLFTSFDIDQAREIKDNCCYISKEPREEIALYQNTTACNMNYKLPDGNWVTIGPERFQAAEVLFYPGLLGKDEMGLPDMLYESLKESSEDYKQILSKSIILSGGTTMLPGFSQRLVKVLREKHRESNSNLHCKIIDPLNRKILVFLGAAIVSLLLENYPEQWISKADWAEEGIRAVYKF
jgi:actin-related protein 2